MPDLRDPNNTGKLTYCGAFVFFQVNLIACLPPWTIKIIFIMDLTMTLNPFVFKAVLNIVIMTWSTMEVEEIQNS